MPTPSELYLPFPKRKHKKKKPRTEEQKQLRREYDEKNKDRMKQRRAEYYAKHRHEEMAYKRKYEAENIERVRQWRRNSYYMWKERTPDPARQREFWRDRTLRKTYKITLDDYNRIFASQNKCCAVCETPTPTGRGDWHIDHDHDSGKVRGILCHLCNMMLGTARDKPRILRAGAEYLIRTNTPERS